MEHFGSPFIVAVVLYGVIVWGFLDAFERNGKAFLEFLFSSLLGAVCGWGFAYLASISHSHMDYRLFYSAAMFCFFAFPLLGFTIIQVFHWWTGGSAERSKRREKARILRTNNRTIDVTCPNCGQFYRVNSVHGGSTQACQCGNAVSIPTYAEFSEKLIDQNANNQVTVETPSKQEPEYCDLETAITFFASKKSRIENLDIDEDEKELLLIRLQEKKENALEQLI